MVCKVVPRTSTPTHRGVSETQEQQNLAADYETALDSVGYGRFSRSVAGACACAFFTTGVENCLMSYVLPAARCELELTTYQTGLVNMAFMCGGVASAFFWGIVGDVFGRRRMLSMTLIMDGFITLAQSTISDYRVLLAVRSINGFLIGCPSTLVFTYLSDLVGVKRRQFYLNITGMSFVAAWLILPAIAWLVIPFKVDYETIFPIYSWRLYTALASLPGFISGIWILFLPESPRLLADTNRSDKALKILENIHKRNGSLTEFKIKKLIPDNIFVAKTVSSDQNRTKELFVAVLKDLKMFISKSYAFKSTIILFVFFANMSAGFGLNMWIPILLLRMQGRSCNKENLSNPESARLMNASTIWRESTSFDIHPQKDIVGRFNDSLFDTHHPRGDESCNEIMNAELFTSNLIVGVCCVLGNAAGALLCARGGALGVRRAAAACALACALACGALAACACGCSSSNKVAVAAAALLNAASLNGNVLLIRLLLHALPPKLSGLGVCWGAWWGRAGGVVSNLAVGVLLDYSCPAPFVSVAALLALSIGAIMMIELKTGATEESEDKTVNDNVEKNQGLDRYISTHM